MAMKKGFEMQFHWIFILIAGALILAFFFSIVQKQTSLSKEKLSITLAANMEAIFTGAIESKGTAQILETPRTGISFYCSEACDCNFVIGRKSTGFKDKFIFAPDYLTGQDMTVWSLEWKSPFRISNFFFISSPEIKYYFIYDTNNLQSDRLRGALQDSLPEEIKFEFKSKDEIGLITKKDQRARFIFLLVDPSAFLNFLRDDFKEAEVSILYIKDESILRFFTLEKDSFIQTDSFYFGQPSLFGAIFSDDKNMYECSIRNAFKKMARISEIYSARVNELSKTTSCVYLTEHLSLLSTLSNEIAGSDIATATSLLNQLAEANLRLEEQNRDKILESCPEIY